MAWVRTVEPREATGEILAVYQKISGTERPEFIPNIMRACSIKPRILDAVHELNRAVRTENDDSGLTPVQREMIATVVSATLECRY